MREVGNKDVGPERIGPNSVGDAYFYLFIAFVYDAIFDRVLPYPSPDRIHDVVNFFLEVKPLRDQLRGNGIHDLIVRVLRNIVPAVKNCPFQDREDSAPRGSSPYKSAQEPVDPEMRDLDTKVRGGYFLEVMGFVKDYQGDIVQIYLAGNQIVGNHLRRC